MPSDSLNLRIEEILFKGLKVGASDVIITAGSPPLYRISGSLIPAKSTALSPEETKKIVYQMLNEPQIEVFERKKELDFSFAFKGQVRFRCNAYLQRGAVSVALRMIPKGIPGKNELRLPDVIDTLAASLQGLVLVTGPTGHGKSTTQAYMIQRINETRRCHVVTVEDPVEFTFENKLAVIDQREVGEDTLSFADALKHVLRQSPDVILVGEMRDPESISAALTAAETGHLVISTLHTNDSVQAIERIIDVFPSQNRDQIRMQLSLSLIAAIAQRLIKRKDEDGMVPAVEMLVNTNAVANMIREGKTHQLYAVLETGSRDGMKTMDQALKELYVQGQISRDDAVSRMRNPQLIA